jgi:hypothetical protein
LVNFEPKAGEELQPRMALSDVFGRLRLSARACTSLASLIDFNVSSYQMVISIQIGESNVA